MNEIYYYILTLLFILPIIKIIIEIIIWVRDKIDQWYIANSFEITVGYQYLLSKNKKEIENYNNIGNQMVEIININQTELYPDTLFIIKTIHDNKIYKIKNL